MSQIAKLFDGTILADVETLTGDVGGAVPATAHNINLLTGDGLTSTGNPATSTITLTLDGFAAGTGQTIGAVTANVITINLGAVATSYFFEANITGFEATTPAGCAYRIRGAVRTTGAAATIIGVPDEYVSEDAALVTGDVDVVAVGNTIIVQPTGVAGLTINWRATTNIVGV